MTLFSSINRWSRFSRASMGVSNGVKGECGLPSVDIPVQLAHLARGSDQLRP